VIRACAEWPVANSIVPVNSKNKEKNVESLLYTHTHLDHEESSEAEAQDQEALGVHNREVVLFERVTMGRHTGRGARSGLGVSSVSFSRVYSGQSCMDIVVSQLCFGTRSCIK